MRRFAVIDTETTGLGKTDRILEIGVVLVDGENIVQEWETLVNPERDISNSSMHGITSEIVSLAPIFSEILDEVSKLLTGRILVAHNLPFDSRMIANEFSRSRKEIDFGSGFCTLAATHSKLSVACEKYKITNITEHRALTDARATSSLLSKVFKDSNTLKPVSVNDFDPIKISRILSRAASSDSHLPGNQNLRRITQEMDVSSLDGAYLSYFDALAYVMSDLKITENEKANLSSWAYDLGLTEADQERANSKFIQLLIDAAKRDQYISELEKKLILKAAKELAIEVDSAELESHNSVKAIIEPGIRICFTGKATDKDGTDLSREHLESLAVNAGYKPVTSVTKKDCDLLVAADKSSMSGKTKKARDWGITVISVAEFLEKIE